MNRLDGLEYTRRFSRAPQGVSSAPKPDAGMPRIAPTALELAVRARLRWADPGATALKHKIARSQHHRRLPPPAQRARRMARPGRGRGRPGFRIGRQVPGARSRRQSPGHHRPGRRRVQPTVPGGRPINESVSTHVGLDVHKDTTAIAVAGRDSGRTTSRCGAFPTIERP